MYISEIDDEIIINMSDDALYEGFNLSKNTEENYHIGEANKNNIVCPYCRCIIIKTGQAIKVKKDVSNLNFRFTCLQMINFQPCGISTI